jgi:hypothetical protein
VSTLVEQVGYDFCTSGKHVPFGSKPGKTVSMHTSTKTGLNAFAVAMSEIIQISFCHLM